jgi:hypothetical protein
MREFHVSFGFFFGYLIGEQSLALKGCLSMGLFVAIAEIVDLKREAHYYLIFL